MQVRLLDRNAPDSGGHSSGGYSYGNHSPSPREEGGEEDWEWIGGGDYMRQYQRKDFNELQVRALSYRGADTAVSAPRVCGTSSHTVRYEVPHTHRAGLA